MSKHLLTAAGGAILILATGCHYTRIARPEPSGEMQDWEAIIRESYPGYTPPPTTTRIVRPQTPARPAPMETPAPAPADVPTEAPAPEALPADTPAPAADAPAEAPAPAPATDAVVEVPADPAADTPAETPAPAPAADTPAETPAPAPAADTPAADAPAATPSGQTPPDPTNSTVYEVKSGDTLGSIAQRIYGDARYSSVIHRANTDILPDPNKLRPGMKLIVPKL